MTKKVLSLSIFAVIIIIGLILGIYYYINGGFGKYVLNGTISQCVYNSAVVYQYVPNMLDAKPQHFAADGTPIACVFNGRVPDVKCQELLRDLRGCDVIYRTDKDMQMSTPMYKNDKGQAKTAIKIIRSNIK